MNHDRRSASAVSSPEAQPKGAGGGDRGAKWVVRVSMEFTCLPHKLKKGQEGDALSDRAKAMMLVLARNARDKPYCWPGNKYLARVTGKGIANVKSILRELEAGGWIKRIDGDAGRDERVGFVLLRRPDPQHPISDGSDESIDAARRAILGKSSPARGSKSSPARGSKSSPELDSIEKDAVRTMTMMGPESSSSATSPVSGEDRGEEKPAEAGPRAAEILARAREIFGDDQGLRHRVLKAVGEHGEAWTGQALAEAWRKKAEGGPVRWGFVLKTLRNWKEEGGPSPKADTRPDTPEERTARAERARENFRRAMDGEERAQHIRRGSEGFSGSYRANYENAYGRPTDSQLEFIGKLWRGYGFTFLSLTAEAQREILAPHAESIDKDRAAAQCKAMAEGYYPQAAPRPLELRQPPAGPLARPARMTVAERISADNAARAAKTREIFERRKANAERGGFSTGVAVDHPDYGRGRVASVVGEGDAMIVVVEFPTTGTRRFRGGIAPLRVVEDAAASDVPA